MVNSAPTERGSIPNLKPIGGSLMYIAQQVVDEGQDFSRVLSQALGLTELNATQQQALSLFTGQIRDLKTAHQLASTMEDGPLFKNLLKVLVGEELGKNGVFGKDQFPAANSDVARRKAVTEVVDVLLVAAGDAQDSIRAILDKCLQTVGDVRDRVKAELDAAAQRQFAGPAVTRGFGRGRSSRPVDNRE